MSWTCEQVESRLSESVDHLLAPGEQQEFLAHAESCARCRPLVAQVRGVVAQMHGLEPLEVPAQLTSRILEATLGLRTERPGWRAWLGRGQFVFQPRFAMGVATTALAGFFVFQGLGISLAELSSPASFYRAANRRVHLIYARGVKFFNDLRVVYEIQSRLQPETPPEPPPEAQPSPEGKAPKPEPGKERNRADEPKSNPVMLVATLSGCPGRSWR